MTPEDAGYRHSSLDSEVDAIVKRYRSVKTPTTVIYLSKTPGYPELFNHVFRHHISLIQSRPKQLEAGHITVYDKALLVLTNNGNSLSHFGAIELFKDEILGIRSEEDMGKLDALFSKNIALRAILGHVTGWKREAGAGLATPVISRTESRERGEPLTPPTSASKKELDDQLAVMLMTFATSQLEHSSLIKIKDYAQYRAARSLRDSAKDTLEHLRGHNPDHCMVPVLQQAFDMAQREIVELDRGTKRLADACDQERLDHRVRRRRRCLSLSSPRRRRSRRGIADCYRPSE